MVRRTDGKLPRSHRLQPVPEIPDETGSLKAQLKGPKKPVYDDTLPQVIRDPPPYPARPWKPLPLPLVVWHYPTRSQTQSDASSEGVGAGRLPAGESRGSWGRSADPDVIYQEKLVIISNTQDPTAAWGAYSYILSLQDSPKIPFQHLHRLCRLLGRSKPKNRILFLRLLSLMYYILRSGGVLHLFEWNTLIDIAGKGVRKPSPQDFKLAVDTYADMGSWPKPDIVTYTTLLNHATKTLHGPALHHATRLLTSSGISPNRITQLCLLSYHTTIKSLVGVRKVLATMQRENMELGIDGVNSCIWAYAHNRQLAMVTAIYRVLRHSLWTDAGQSDIEELRRYHHTSGMRPNEVTFTCMVQCMAYNGSFHDALEIFKDMMLTDNTEVGAPLVPDEKGVLKPVRYAATMAVYRAMFLGFARHGVLTPSPTDDTLSAQLTRASNSPWSLSNLRDMFATFVATPDDIVPTKSVLYWIMVAFNRTSGEDLEVVRAVWYTLCNRFDGPWGGSNNRLQRLHYALECEDDRARVFLREMSKFNNNDSGWANESGWR
ncbi:hypothetical protein BDZ89DRAFT_1058542 [Hymenopellis radicata]|nr:hypothetical protein BDZ89DRAFT_1058542 [Hymenopellis radicata]